MITFETRLPSALNSRTHLDMTRLLERSEPSHLNNAARGYDSFDMPACMRAYKCCFLIGEVY